MITLNICVGSACHIKGSYNVINTFLQIIEERNLADKVEVKAVFCLGHCTTEGVSVKINDGEVHGVSGFTAKEFFETEVLPKLDL